MLLEKCLYGSAVAGTIAYPALGEQLIPGTSAGSEEGGQPTPGASAGHVEDGEQTPGSGPANGNEPTPGASAGPAVGRPAPGSQYTSDQPANQHPHKRDSKRWQCSQRAGESARHGQGLVRW